MEPVSAPAAYVEAATRVMSPAAVASRTQPTQVRRRAPDDRQPAPEPYYGEPPRGRSVWQWILVIVLILALAGGAYAILSNWGSAAGDLAIVPGVLGLSEADAKTKIEAAAFAFENAGNQPSADVTAGDVARQDTQEGTKLAKGK